MALNHVSIMGRICNDLELKHTQSNVPVISFAIASERDYKDASGERQTDFIDVVAWRNTAEFISNYFGKGRMIIVAGKLQTRTWTDTNGNKRKAVEIIADSAYFGDSKNNANSETNASSGGFGVNMNDFEEIEAGDDELPF